MARNPDTVANSATRTTRGQSTWETAQRLSFFTFLRHGTPVSLTTLDYVKNSHVLCATTQLSFGWHKILSFKFYLNKYKKNEILAPHLIPQKWYFSSLVWHKIESTISFNSYCPTKHFVNRPLNDPFSRLEYFYIHFNTFSHREGVNTFRPSLLSAELFFCTAKTSNAASPFPRHDTLGPQGLSHNTRA